MKNKFLLFFMVTVLVALPSLSFAASTTSKETIRDRLETRKKEIKQNMASRTEEVKNNIEQRKQNATNKIEIVMNNFVDKVTERLNATAGRMDILVQRIDSRIAKMETRNIDTTKAKELLVTAKAKIETAKADIALITLNTNINSTASTTVSTLKEAFGVTKTQIEKAKQDLKAAHATLVDVVNSLKQGDNKTKDSTASTTATTTKSD